MDIPNVKKIPLVANVFVTKCEDCPLLGSTGSRRCYHPAFAETGGPLVLNHIVKSTKPTWCPLLKSPLTISLSGEDPDLAAPAAMQAVG